MGSTTADRFLEVLRLATVQAGTAAKLLRGKVKAERKGSGSSRSVVTVADLVAQETMLLALAEHLPDVAVDAEESTETVRQFPSASTQRPLVVLDPVDGTYNYTTGSRDYAVMASLLLEGRFQAAVVYLPEADELWWAQRGQGCFVARGAREPRRVTILEAPKRVLVTPGVGATLRDRLAELGEIEVSRCSAIDSSAPAMGRGAVSFVDSPIDRRRATPFLLTTEAGGVVLLGTETWDGEDPLTRTGPRTPCVVAADRTLAERARNTAYR